MKQMIFLFLFAFAAQAQNKFIVTSTETPGVSVPSQSGQSGKFLTTNGTVMSWATAGGGSGPTVLRKTADQAITVAGFVNVTDLGFTADASGVYFVKGFIMYQSSATTMGVLLSFNGPASPTKMRIHTAKELTAVATAGTDKFSEVVATAYDTPNPNSTAEIAANTDQLFWFEGVFVNGANAGTFTLRLSKENVAGTATIMANSYMQYQKIN